MQARQLQLAALSRGDVQRWRALADRAIEPNPFFEPSFVQASSEHLLERGTSLLVVEDGEAWRACLPVQAARVGRIVPVLRTWAHLYCFLGTPLLDPAAPAAAARSLLELALAHAPGDQLKLEALDDEGPVAAVLRQAADGLGLAAATESRHERALLRRRPSDDYLATMRGHRRRELDRLGRRLAGVLGSPLSVTEEAASDLAVDRFLELERSGWKGRGETALGSTTEHADFFRSVYRAFAAEGRLQLLALSAGDQAVAMKCNLYAGEGGFCFKIAHDERFARFSPGVQLERENVRIFHDDRAELWQDSCADPDNEMINRLWPDRRPISTIVLTARGIRGRVGRQGIRAVGAARQMKRRISSTSS